MQYDRESEVCLRLWVSKAIDLDAAEFLVAYLCQASLCLHPKPNKSPKDESAKYDEGHRAGIPAVISC